MSSDTILAEMLLIDVEKVIKAMRDFFYQKQSKSYYFLYFFLICLYLINVFFFFQIIFSV